MIDKIDRLCERHRERFGFCGPKTRDRIEDAVRAADGGSTTAKLALSEVCGDAGDWPIEHRQIALDAMGLGGSLSLEAMQS